MALKVLSALETNQMTISGTPTNSTDAATVGYVSEHSGSGDGGLSYTDVGVSEWVQQDFENDDPGYSAGDIVVHNGTLYKSKSNSNYQLPTNTSYWDAVTYADYIRAVIPKASNGVFGVVRPDNNTVYIDNNGSLASVSGGIQSWKVPSNSTQPPLWLVAYNDRLWVSLCHIVSTAASYPGVANQLTQTHTWADVGSVQNLTEVQLTSGSTTLSNISNSWRVTLPSGVSESTIVLPNVTVANSLVITYELLLYCPGSGSASVSFSNVTFLSEGINPTITFEKGYNHFLVFRNFPAMGTATEDPGDASMTRQWVGNIQGKVRIPTS